MKDEALKLALEALERIAEAHGEWTNGIWAANKALNAITAIKQALAEPVQEPVGCEGAIVNGRVYADRLEHDYKFDCEAGPLHLCNDWVEFRRCFEWLAVHATPPAAQRQWVGVTLSDREKLRDQFEGWSYPAILVDAVSDILEEKNT